MGGEDGGRQPEEVAREHERIQREIENRARSTEGGLTPDDIAKIARQATREDRDRILEEQQRNLWPDGEPGPQPTESSSGESGRLLDEAVKSSLERGFRREPTEDADERRDRDRIEQERLRDHLDHDPDATESILDEIDDTGLLELSPDEAPVLTGGMRDALKRPENMIRLFGAGLGIIGLLVLMLGLRAELRAEANQAPGGAIASPPVSATASPTAAPTASATAAGSPIAQASPPVTGAATANASFTKVSGPCDFAARFTDRYSFAATNGALTLTQLSNGHVSRGTIAPNGDFTTMADGQGYRGRLSGTTATGQHTYTADGCNEVYDFTMRLSEPLLAAGGQASPATNPPPAATPTLQATATATAPPATGTPVATASPATGTVGGPNLPLALLGTLFMIGGLGLLVRGPILVGGPRIPKEASKDPCDREKAAEAAARERLARARARYEQVSSLSEASRDAQQEAEAKARAAEDAKRDASYAESDGVRHYTNKKKAAEIGAAEAGAAAARDAAARAKAAYDAAGGQNEWTAAQDELYKANRDWEQANESLQRCLQLFAPAPPPPPSTTAGGTTAGGTALSGPTVATGSSMQTRERTCTHGEVKPGSERTRTREITVNEINRAEVILDATYPGAQHVPLTEFVEFMDFFRGAFKAGKAIHTVVDGTLVEGALDTIDATGIADVPDFLTYWDKLTEATLKGLKQTGDIFIDRFGKLGDYQLKFTRLTYTAPCRTWEECDAGRWVQKGEVKVEIARTERDRRTRTIEVHDKAEIGDAINRLFTELEGENERGTRDLKAFEESCGR